MCRARRLHLLQTFSAHSPFQGFTARYLLILKWLSEVCDCWSQQNLISLNPAQPHTRWGVLSWAGTPGAVPRPGCSWADLFCGLVHCCNLACDSLGGGLGCWEQCPMPKECPRCFVQEGSGGLPAAPSTTGPHKLVCSHSTAFQEKMPPVRFPARQLVQHKSKGLFLGNIAIRAEKKREQGQ